MGKRFKKNYRPLRRKPEFRINEFITAPEVRIVGETGDVEQGVYTTGKAVELALGLGLDLVEISPKAEPPVCKIIDYNKFLYERKKKQKEIKSNSKKTVLKEIRFGPNTDVHDFEFKLKHAEKFLKEGAKVKAYVFFRGRSIVFKERGELLLLQFAERLADLANLEQLPKLEGKRMIVFLSPKAKKS